MRLLILGGTAWLGHEVAAAAVARGHDVTCLARGDGVPPGVTIVHGDRDRTDGLSGVSDDQWDTVIDVARQPGHVRRAVQQLRTDHYVFVSTVSVYASHQPHGQDESAPTLPPLVADDMSSPMDYGAAKVACEAAVRTSFGGDRSTIVRPGLIGGPGDPSGRTTYWPWRFAHPSHPAGLVLVPDSPAQPTAVLDVRDLAIWLVSLGAAQHAGVFNAAGPTIPLAESLAVARSVAGGNGTPVPAPESWLVEHGVQQWAGPRSLPLWIRDPDDQGMNTHATHRAVAAGLGLRPLAETFADGLRAGRSAEAAAAAGLSDEDERALLADL